MLTDAGVELRCPKCGNDDASMLEQVPTATGERWFCNTCAHDWAGVPSPPSLPRPVPAAVSAAREPSERRALAPSARAVSGRFRSLEQLLATTGARRDELATLAEIGALNAFGYDRRTALWQIERASRPAGELFEEKGDGYIFGDGYVFTESDPTAPRPEDDARANALAPTHTAADRRSSTDAAFDVPLRRPPIDHPPVDRAPLAPMTLTERIVADYQGTGLTIGPHPMALRRGELALRGVLRATDLSRGRHGRRVRVAGAVITRQRPGTAKGFVFLTLEDETGIANVIVQPDVFDRQRLAIVSEPFIVVEGLLQIQEGVTAVKAEHVVSLGHAMPPVESHDFH